jgi:hypothetical protein
MGFLTNDGLLEISIGQYKTAKYSGVEEGRMRVFLRVCGNQ